LPLDELAARSGEAWIMIDRKRKGMRCTARNMIRSREVTIQPANQGTIIYEIENLGRRLILVQWDGDSSTYAFPDEVDITETLEEPQPSCQMRRER
jgi:hypothetical protein